MNKQKIKLYNILKYPLLFIFVMWGVKFFEVYFEISFVEYGVLPRDISGIKGVLLSPFIHKDFKHLINNTFPIIVLGSLLCYFYKKNYKLIFPMLYVVSGILLWGIGRTSFHIGASGIIYALASFIFFSGLISKNKNLAALSLTVIFVYGSLFWGLFPIQLEMSWEGHLSGFLSGLIFAWSYRDELPVRKKYQWEIDEEIEEKAQENSIKINYEYKEK